MQSAPPLSALPARARPSVQFMPVSLFGAVMSMAGLALAWRLANKAYGTDLAVSKSIGDLALALFVVLGLAYGGKLARYPALVKKEFSHPVIGSFFGTVCISILLLSSVIGGYSATGQVVVWLIGVALTLALSAIMISRLLNGNIAPESVVPAWLIAGVGSLDIVVTGGTQTAAWAHEVNLVAAAIGAVSALVFFVLIFSRLVHQEPLAQPMRPSKMILVAPFAVGFIAYVNLAQKVDVFAGLLFYFGLFLFVIIAYRLIVKPVAFSAAWWGIGFPMAALTNAALIYAGAVRLPALDMIAALMLCVLTVAVIVLSVRTVVALLTGRMLTA